MKNNMKHEEGFTIIEIMVVILIIGILSAISTPILKKYIKTSVESTLVSDVREAAVQMEKDAVLSKNGSYSTVISEDYHNSENNNIVLLEDDYSDYSDFCIIGRNDTYKDLYVYYSSQDRIVTTAKNPTGDCGTGMSYPIVEAPGGTPKVEESHEVDPPSEQPPTPSPTEPPATEPPAPGPSPTQPPTEQQPATKPPVVQPPAPNGYSDSKRKKYKICHNGNALNLPLPGILNGHAGHNSDIIPPIPYAYPTGLNWTVAGAATWYNNCV